MTELAQERLIDRRRRLISLELGDVAISLFAERGFEAVTVDDIARTAGISQRTFFRHFSTKAAVVLDYEHRVQQRLVDITRERPKDEGPVTALKNGYLITSHVEPEDLARVVQLGRILREAPTLRANARSVRATPNAELLVEIARRMGASPDDLRPRVILTAVSSVALAEWDAWVDEEGPGDPSERISRAINLIEVGLGNLDGPISPDRSSEALIPMT